MTLRPQNRLVYAKFDANYRGFCIWKAKKQKVRFLTKSTDTQWIMTNFAEFRSRNNKAQRATRSGGPMVSGQLAVTEGGPGGRRAPRLFRAETDAAIHVGDDEGPTLFMEGLRNGGERAWN